MSAAAQRATRAPLARAAAAHAIAVPLALLLAPSGMPWEAPAAVLAGLSSWVLGLAPWWIVINALFVPALKLGLNLEISPLWALGALATLLLVYGRIWASRVPLFFSSAGAHHALAALLPRDRPIAFLDAGCGDARVIAHLASARPDSRFEGIEHALVPWLIARLRCWKTNAEYYVRRGDLWGHGLTQYDVVFAYLSPAVMPRFWEKAKREMRPGSLLVTAFGIPGVRAGSCVDIGDRMNTRLHVCRIGGESAAAS